MTRIISLIAIFLAALLLVEPVAAQKQGVDILLSKARSLESRGRMDLAAQNWRQVLLVSPNQTEALGGLARYAKENGDAEGERNYLDRLKKVDPKSPEIAAVEKMHVLTPQERDRLDEAGRLAMQHKPDEALKIYNEVFGNRPPSGKWAEPYYETEAASAGGRPKAITQLRALTASDPGNETYRLWLGRVLVYDPKTRMEGLKLLESLRDPGVAEQARSQWHDALLWEKQNPAVLPFLDAYLQRYPDPELQGIQKDLQVKQEHALEDASKQKGFQALRSKDMGTAEAKFQDVLRRSPNDANAVAGLAFVRLNQKRFDEAVTLFDRARALAPQRADIRQGYETAKFWSLMQQGSNALQHNDPEPAIAAYKAALSLHPDDQSAMLGIAQAELREKRLPEAEAQFQEVLNQSPDNSDAIAGLAFIRLDQKRFDDAAGLFDKARKLVPNRPDLQQGYNDAHYWALMQHGATALDQNNSNEAISDYKQALAIKPGSADALQALAGASERGGDVKQAEQAYRQLTGVNPSDANSWTSLLRVEIAAKQYQQALDTSARIPAPVQAQLNHRADYLAELALAYYNTKQQQQGDIMLNRAMQAASASDSTEALNKRLEIANLLMQQGKTQRALDIYKQATKLHPDNALAWEAIVGAYAQQRDFNGAETALRAMARSVYDNAAHNPEFLRSVASIYSEQGECGRAEDLLNRSVTLDRAAGRPPTVGTQLQLADIWFREKNYAKARDAYRNVLNHDQNSLEAWRGYLTSLHETNDDTQLLSESQRMPIAMRTQTEKDPDFLTLIAGSEGKVGHAARSVQLLQKARDLYQAQNQMPPAELDVQLAWAMLNDRQTDPRLFIQKVKNRSDLTGEQRAALDEVLADWSMRAADQSVKNKKPEQAIGILTDAQRELPNDPRIPAALALVFVNEHKYHEALDIYKSWSMAGASAGDYSAAAGSAQAVHNDQLANFYLREGLQHFPDDSALLEMQGKQFIARGDYKTGQTYLKEALSASRHPETRQNFAQQNRWQTNSFVERSSSNVSSSNRGVDSDATSATSISPKKVNGCRNTSSYFSPARFRAKLINASLSEEDQAQDQTGGTQGTQSAPEQPNSNQTGPTTATPNTNNPNQTAPDQTNANATPGKQEQLQDEIDVVENRNTPFADISDSGSGRAGDPGIDRLIVEEGIVGGSVTALDKVRITTDAKGLFLYSGTPTGKSNIRFGTLQPGATFGLQETGGMTGELQISTATFGLDFSATPQGFPVQNLLGGIRFRPFNGPITFMAVRDSVKDSLLSYAGTRDPGTGLIWGGVVSNTGTLQFEHHNRRGGLYASGSFSYITGKNVLTNWNGSGNAGFYFVVAKNLSVGLSASGMHYERNQSFFTLGQGGYFSPQRYGLAAIPISWFSRHKRFEYEIRASLGAQYIEQDASTFFPKRINVLLPPQGVFNSSTSYGANYYFLGRLGYRIASHVYLDTFATANNSRNYATQTVGFSIKILAHRLPTNTDLHVNSIPDWKGNQPFGIE